MGKEKAGFLTPKAIANRIKAKGLQKLRWYCQMCQKQCRDENGFKCHMTSESHQRQLLLFAENPDKYVDDFSQQFMDEYLELLSRRFGTKRVHCNIVYQEYIAFREHVHMNATQWETLTDFVKWLGREGKCTVDYTEKGWFVQYIDRDPEAIKKQEATRAKEKMELDDEERTAKFIQRQIERAREQEKNPTESNFTELKRENEEEKVSISLSGVKSKKPEEKVKREENPFKSMKKSDHSETKQSESDVVKTEKKKSRWEDAEAPKAESSKPSLAGHKRKSALDEIMESEEHRKEKMNRKDYWLSDGIVVKVITKKLGDKYYKKKAVIKEVHDLYRALIKMVDSGDKLKVDQSHLETVIPAQGKLVKIVNGAYRNQIAVLESINEKKFSCTLSLHSISGKIRALKVCESRFSTHVAREVQTLNRLDHPNIVKVLRQEREVDTGKPVVVVELCENGNLLSLLYKPQNGYGLDEEEYLHFFQNLVSAVQYTREHGILHRDIKPGNILVAKDERGQNVYKLSDFAESIPLKESETFKGVVGTDAYMHPDLFKEAYLDKKKHQNDYDESADLWSIGVTLYHVATGEVPFRPFQGRMDREKMYEMISTKPADVVSAHQLSQNGPIVWKDDLPPTCRLSRNFKDIISKLVRDLCANQNSKPYGFQDLFRDSNDLFISRRVYYFIVGYRVNSVYIDDNTNILELLKCMISPTADVEFFYNGRHINKEPLPETSFTKPIHIIPYGEEVESQEDELSLEATMKYVQQTATRSFSPDPNNPNTSRDAAAAKAMLYVIALVLRTVREASMTLDQVTQTLMCLRDRTTKKIEKCEQLLQCISMFCDNYKSAQTSHTQYISSYERYREQSSCRCPQLKAIHTKYVPSLAVTTKTEAGAEIHEERCVYYKMETCREFLRTCRIRMEKDFDMPEKISFDLYRLERCQDLTDDLQKHFKSFRTKSFPSNTDLAVHRHYREKVLQHHKESLSIMKEVNKTYKKGLRHYHRSLRLYKELTDALIKMETALQKCMKDLSLGTIPKDLQLTVSLPTFSREMSRSDEYLSSHSMDDEDQGGSRPEQDEDIYYSAETTKYRRGKEDSEGESDDYAEDYTENDKMGKSEAKKQDLVLKIAELDIDPYAKKGDRLRSDKTLTVLETVESKHGRKSSQKRERDKSGKAKEQDLVMEIAELGIDPDAKKEDRLCSNKMTVESKHSRKSSQKREQDKSGKAKKQDLVMEIAELDFDPDAKKEDRLCSNETKVESKHSRKSRQKHERDKSGKDMERKKTDENSGDPREIKLSRSAKNNEDDIHISSVEKREVKRSAGEESREQRDKRMSRRGSKNLDQIDEDRRNKDDTANEGLHAEKRPQLYKPQYNGVSQETVV
ncbi:hypothetical protein FSP39_002831 [Pinctada imbricata]|uniref:Protein kinase domain-containing protein n=1 Tax=Pinctada imbricata TaxID=66713 RepID=A0AA88YH87_PINIB|nr:hypothetical protein FSP39_002831 [Pinctada imbricata]